MSPPAAPARERRILLGIFFICCSGALFPIMNGLVKLLSAGYESPQIVWARTLGHLIFVLALFAPARGVVGILRTTRLPWQIGRGTLLLLSTLCFFSAVQFVPLAKAASISFTAPLIVTILAVPMLGERIGLAARPATASTRSSRGRLPATTRRRPPSSTARSSGPS
jgi:drug/metabolite transporter (DMT)-like permease